SCEVLRNGVPLPHRGRDPIYIPQRNRVLYCVHSTPVYSSNGYSIRTEGIAEGLSENGLDVTVAARAGYPWDDGHRLPEQRIERRHRGILYVHNPAKPLVSSSLKASIDEIADAFVREARRS